jgi:hypothetical protein
MLSVRVYKALENRNQANLTHRQKKKKKEENVQQDLVNMENNNNKNGTTWQ